MRPLLFAVLGCAALTACAAPSYYVANVFRDKDDLYVQRCLINGGSHGDKPNPSECKYEKVGAPPPEATAPAK